MEAPSLPDIDLPPPRGDAVAAPDEVDDATDRLLLGVAGFVADGLGMDALWVRLGFVLLALAGGIGVVLYLALWLTIFGPEYTGLAGLRYVGGAAAIVAVPWMAAAGGTEFVDGPVAVIALLVGLTLALWQPRRTSTGSPVAARRRPTQVLRGSAAEAPLDVTSDGPSVVTSGGDLADLGADQPTATAQLPASNSPRRRRRVRRRREPSMLGRLTLALAVIVAAVGALIDQFNGGGLHPEQWLGAAAIVCGVGLLVGAVRGRAWWLVVPAIVFSGSGYVAGIMARVGIDVVEAFDSQSIYVSEGRPGGTESIQRAVGTAWISVDGAPQAPLTIDARVAIGDVEISVADNVAVEVRVDSDRGDLVVDGIVVADGVRRIGPDGTPSVIVDARLGIGDVNVFTYDPRQRFTDNAMTGLLDGEVHDPRLFEHGIGIPVDDGVGISADGWIVLAYGEALLAPDNSVVVGNTEYVGSQVVSIFTGMGTFVVDGATLFTPNGSTYHLDELRRDFGLAMPDVTVPPAPSTTLPLDVLPVEPVPLKPDPVDPGGVDPGGIDPDLVDPSATNTTVGG